MKMAGLKKLNEYVGMVKEYDRIPKAVFAAIAISYAIQLEPDIWKDELFAEWGALYMNRIVPQKPIPFEPLEEKE